MAIKRNRIIKVRVSPGEYKKLKARCRQPQLATWIREVCLGQSQLKRSKIPHVNPRLLRQLVGMGNNLNQIARVVNAQHQDNTVNLIQILALLSALERDLAQLLVSHGRV